MGQHIDRRIVKEAQRITAKAGVQAVLLSGSYARGLRLSINIVVSKDINNSYILTT